MSYSKVVKTKDGVEKTVIANSQEELNEAVKVAQGDQAPVGPDINNPEDGNKEASPDNKQTDPRVSDKFKTNNVTQDGKQLPEEPKADNVEEPSKAPTKTSSKKK